MYFAETISDKDSFLQINIPTVVYELESLSTEIWRIFNNEGRFIEAKYPFTIKPSFSTLGSIKENSRQEPLINFTPDDSIRDLLGFNPGTIYEKFDLSSNPVDLLLFDNIFLKTDIAQGMVFEGKRSGIIHIFTMDVDPRYKDIEKFFGWLSWYMMEFKDFISNLSFKLKFENGSLLPFNG